MQRVLILSGVAILVLGLVWPWVSKLGLGRLPGDILIDRGNVRFYLPLATGLLISAVLSLLFWLFRK